jgi:PAS domain-containing protein
MRLGWLGDRWQASVVKAALSGASPSSRGLSGVVAGLILASLLIGGLAIWSLRVDAVDDARRDTHSLGVIIAEQTARSMQAVDLVLQQVRGEIDAAGITTPDRLRSALGTQEFHETLVGHVTNLLQAEGIVVVGADGRLVNSTRFWPVREINTSDREYFRYFSTHNDPGVFVSEPLGNGSTGARTIFLVRRISGPDGEFLGLLVGAMGVTYFEDLYRAMELPDGAGVTLLRRNGVVIVHYPVVPEPTVSRMPEASPWHRMVQEGGGWYRSPGWLGLGRLLVSVHPLDRYPIVVDTTLSEDVALAVWRRQAAFTVLGALCGVLCILVLMRALIGQFRGLEAAQASLAEKSHLLEITLEHMDQGLVMVNADGLIPVFNQKAIEMLELSREFVDTRPSYPEVLAYLQRAQDYATNEEIVKDILQHDLERQPFQYRAVQRCWMTRSLRSGQRPPRAAR